eukprot:NODE_5136_length_425_cov_9.813830_g4465_i0.p2 GENE.NODE_5136_length_425_cov_9.813830_g4465_i0~~NODE_5136_length_425_cov_9.813830_g4465_i0.p2  ORF type:complete len:83 (+),score=11.20 NODE_5136_length_425_cov_9.813830_g4465_i0:22-249(+)
MTPLCKPCSAVCGPTKPHMQTVHSIQLRTLPRQEYIDNQASSRVVAASRRGHGTQKRGWWANDVCGWAGRDRAHP